MVPATPWTTSPKGPPVRPTIRHFPDKTTTFLDKQQFDRTSCPANAATEKTWWNFTGWYATYSEWLCLAFGRFLCQVYFFHFDLVVASLPLALLHQSAGTYSCYLLVWAWPLVASSRLVQYHKQECSALQWIVRVNDETSFQHAEFRAVCYGNGFWEFRFCIRITRLEQSLKINMH